MSATNASDKISIFSELHYFLKKILASDETDLKYAVKMQLHQGYCLLHKAAKVLLSKSDGILSYRGLKKSYFM